MNFPTKWRETVDPFSLKFAKFKLVEVLGYPHAGNDVFFVKGCFENREVLAFIKFNRQFGADVENEINVLSQINFDNTPKIIDFDEQKTYRVSLALEGERLSTIVGDNSNMESLNYMKAYGNTLAKIHQLKGDFKPVKDRKFFHIPTKEYFEENYLSLDVYEYLTSNAKTNKNLCFCHGDFHYANILWKDKLMTGILDFELSGIGIREFDIAWAIINRPSQKFLKTTEEVEKFLEGYTSINPCNVEYVKYYMVLIYSHFISVDKENTEYIEFVNIDTFESKIIPNLFLEGELLDVDGDCGGYNISFAILSALISSEKVNKLCLE